MSTNLDEEITCLRSIMLNRAIWLGPLIGFGVFIIGTATVDNIYTRPDINGKKVFSLGGLKEFLKAPFAVGTEKFKTVWGIYPNLSFKDRLKMWQLNWIITTGLGIIVSTYLIK
jgi:hypothetical protein